MTKGISGAASAADSSAGTCATVSLLISSRDRSFRARSNRSADSAASASSSSVEPVIREALWRLADDRLPADTQVVGGYWTRTNDPEIDLVGADRAPVAKKITFAGSLKWLENKPFDHRDLARLITHRSQLPGASDDTPLFAVTAADAPPEGSPPSLPRI